MEASLEQLERVAARLRGRDYRAMPAHHVRDLSARLRGIVQRLQWELDAMEEVIGPAPLDTLGARSAELTDLERSRSAELHP